MNLVAQCSFHAFEPLPRYSPLASIWEILFSQHITILFIFFLPIPLSFDSLEGDQRRRLLGNLISWVNAKKWLCCIRRSTLFRTIAVVQWARNLANTNMISSACPGSWQSAEIVWLLQQWKSLRWKIQHRVVSLQLPLILANMGLDTSEQHQNTWKQIKKPPKKREDI